MKIAKRQKIFLFVALLAICVSLLYVVVKTYVDPGLPFGVNDDKFVAFLEDGSYAEAKEFWDKSLANHPSEKDRNLINARFDSFLAEHLRYMDIYCANNGFSPDGFYAQYGNIGDMGDYVKDYLMVAASKSVTRYANLNIRYVHARSVIEMLCDITGDEASKSAMLTALDAYRDIIAEYEKSDEQMQMQNYIGAIETLSTICDHVDKELYLYYLAEKDLATAIEAVKVEADEYAGDRDYAKAASLLQQLCTLTSDEEAQKMLKRVYNIMYPGY
ncbi:MAG: hypothetical protein II359_05395 [Clostridia bacterium]|nr:hypothetical protein [Clostridia bacterium]